MELRNCISKGRDGWKMETAIPMGQVIGDPKGLEREGGQRILDIHTWKIDGGRLATTASCSIVRKDGCSTMVVYGDFNQRVLVQQMRCTEKSVRDQHNHALKQLTEIIAAADAYYAAKEPKAQPEQSEAVAA